MVRGRPITRRFAGPHEGKIEVSQASADPAEQQAPAGAADANSINSMRTTQDIAESINNRLRELNDEIKTLDAARIALDEREDQPSRRRPAGVTKRRSSAPRASSGSKPSRQSTPEGSGHIVPESASRPSTRARKASRPRARRGSSAITADRLESLLSGSGGLTTSALAEQAGGNRDHVLRLLQDLETAGRIRRTGQRRGTRWHPITDEDRIRDRAAELEATRKRRT